MFRFLVAGFYCMRTYQLKISIFRNVKFLQKRKKPEMRTSDDVTILTISFFLNSKYKARCFPQSDETRSYKCWARAIIGPVLLRLLVLGY